MVALAQAVPALGPAVWTLLACAAACAVLDWFLSRRPTTWLRWVSKSAVPALLVVAVALSSVSGEKPSWPAVMATGALALCLLGDILLIEERRFVSGGVAFASAHVLFIGALIWDAYTEGWPSGPGVFVALGLVAVGWAVAGWRVVAGSRGTAMSVLTAAYLVVLSLLVVAAGVNTGAPGGWLALIGAASFFVSDLLLTWRRNVNAGEGDGVWVMVTYHVALFALAGWALVS